MNLLNKGKGREEWDWKILKCPSEHVPCNQNEHVFPALGDSELFNRAYPGLLQRVSLCFVWPLHKQCSRKLCML